MKNYKKKNLFMKKNEAKMPQHGKQPSTLAKLRVNEKYL